MLGTIVDIIVLAFLKIPSCAVFVPGSVFRNIRSLRFQIFKYLNFWKDMVIIEIQYPIPRPLPRLHISPLPTYSFLKQLILSLLFPFSSGYFLEIPPTSCPVSIHCSLYTHFSQWKWENFILNYFVRRLCSNDNWSHEQCWRLRYFTNSWSVTSFQLISPPVGHSLSSPQSCMRTSSTRFILNWLNSSRQLHWSNLMLISS